MNSLINKKKFLKVYFKEFLKLINFNNNTIEKIIITSEELKKTHSLKKKILIFGNGGSSAIASHFSVDLTKNAKIRCVNFNEPDLLTCFSNDFGYSKWVKKAITYYGDEGDTAIFISSSGKSMNMIEGAKEARRKKFYKIISFTGNNKNNELNKLSDINFWVNSKSYNYIENTHQIILLSIVDLLIGKSVYSSDR